MTVIELPDEQAAALTAKAASEGLTLTAWLQALAERDATAQKTRSAKEAVARILELQKHDKPDPEGWTVKDYINHGRP
jgi:DNA/RNA-binding domain of Phe-tRNA-synthetase-like protein